MAFDRFYYRILTFNAFGRYAITLGVLGIVSAIWWFGVRAPLQKRIKHQYQIIDKLQQVCDEYDMCACQIKQFHKPYSQVMNDLIAVARHHDVSIDTYSMEQQMQKSGYIKTTSSLHLSGSFESIAHFLENMKQICSLLCKKCTITKKDDQFLTASLHLLHYNF